MTVLSVLDSAGRRRSPATMPGYHAGRPPRNKGIRYPADPPTIDEIVAVIRHTADDRHGWRVRAMIVVLWRAGLRIQEALALAEHDLDHRRGSLLVRNGKGGHRREVGMDEWGWAAGRTAVLHHGWPDPRAAVVGRRRPQRVPSARRDRRGQASPPTASVANPWMASPTSSPTASDIQAPSATSHPASPCRTATTWSRYMTSASAAELTASSSSW